MGPLPVNVQPAVGEIPQPLQMLVQNSYESQGLPPQAGHAIPVNHLYNGYGVPGGEQPPIIYGVPQSPPPNVYPMPG